MGPGEAIATRTKRLGRRETVGGGKAFPRPGRAQVLSVGLALITVFALAALAHWLPVLAPDEAAGPVRAQGGLFSPNGAYTLKPSLTGPATYSVDVAPDKDTGSPRGTVTFDFPAGGVAFASASIGRVSKRGAVVIVQGTGTLNGRGEYPFALQLGGTVGDADVRLTIWELFGSSNLSWVVYDNG